MAAPLTSRGRTLEKAQNQKQNRNASIKLLNKLLVAQVTRPISLSLASRSIAMPRNLRNPFQDIFHETGRKMSGPKIEPCGTPA